MVRTGLLSVACFVFLTAGCVSDDAGPEPEPVATTSESPVTNLMKYRVDPDRLEIDPDDPFADPPTDVPAPTLTNATASPTPT